MHYNLAASVYRRAQTDPTSPAVVEGERAYTYGDLAAAAARVAALVRAATNPADKPPIVGILAPRGYEAYVGIVGAAWAGGTYLPLDPRLPRGRLVTMIKRAHVDVLIADARGQQVIGELSAIAPTVLQLGVGDGLAGVTPQPQPADVGAGHPAYLIYTSGTTGVPKGVSVPASAINHYLAFMREIFQVSPADRVSQFFATTFDASIAEMFIAWQGGAAVYPVPETKTMAPGGFIRQNGITVFHAVPSVIPMMQRFKQLEPGSLPSLRLSVFGGESLSIPAARAWRAAAVNSALDNQYGPTEAAIGCIWQRIGDRAVETTGRGTLAIGKPFPGISAAILGSDHQFLPVSSTGELAVSGPQLAIGYADDPILTATKFVTLRGRRWYLTGDHAYMDRQGYIHCLGRIDNQVKVMGHRVELEEIDAHLQAVAGTPAAAAIAWPLVNGNAAAVMAFVAAPIDATAVRAKLRQCMPAYMVPSRVFSVDALPLSPNGKIDRKQLSAMLDGRTSA